MLYFNIFVDIHLNLLILLSLFKGYTANMCDFDVKLKQTLLNNGFHRNITYGIVFSNDDDKWLYQDCIVGIDQTLPAGVYANPDELGDLKRTQKLNAVPKNRINIELPAEHSDPSSVYIMGKVMNSKVHLWLPVHARYHQAVAGGGTARNEIGPPKLYIRCPDQRLDACHKLILPALTFLCNGSSKETCSWKEIPYTVMTDTLIWRVPVGNRDHYYIVAIGTASVVVVGSLYVLNAIHGYTVAARRKRL